MGPHDLAHLVLVGRFMMLGETTPRWRRPACRRHSAGSPGSWRRGPASVRRRNGGPRPATAGSSGRSRSAPASAPAVSVQAKPNMMPWSPAPSSLLPAASTPMAMSADWAWTAPRPGRRSSGSRPAHSRYPGRRRGPPPRSAWVTAAGPRTSPAMTMRLVVHMVSTATRGSDRRRGRRRQPRRKCDRRPCRDGPRRPTSLVNR